MPRSLYFLCLLFLISCHQPQKQGKNTQPQDIEALEKKAISLYDVDPMEAIKIYDEVISLSRDINDLKTSGRANLNVAGIYEEKLNKNEQALSYARASLADWKSQNDTMQMANLYKYVGLLEGRMFQFDKAVDHIEIAIRLYEKKNFDQGVAVSHINMAKVKILTGKFDDAELYFNRSKKYWVTQSNYGRIFDNNIVGIELFGVSNQSKKHRALVVENSELMKAHEINEFLIGKFQQLLNNQVD